MNFPPSSFTVVPSAISTLIVAADVTGISLPVSRTKSEVFVPLSVSGRAVSSLFIVTFLSATVLTVNVFAAAFSAATAQSSVRSQLAVIVGVVRVRTASPAVVIFADVTVFGIVRVFSVIPVLIMISSSPVVFALRADAMFSYPVPLTSTGALSGSKLPY